MKNPKYLFIGLSALVLILVLSLLSFTTIDAGEVGVIKSFGQVTGRTLSPGAHWMTPIFNDVVTYNTKKVIYETTTTDKQKGSQADYKDSPVDTNTSDGQQVDVSYTVRFSVDPTKATDVTKTIGNETALVEKIVKTESRIWVRNIVREYSADQLYTGNISEVQVKIEEKIRPTFEANGLLLDSFGIREIKFSDQYAQAIETKQIEAVNVEKAKNIAERAKFEKEAKITQAEASAREQELQRTTISEQLLTKLWIEKWSGELPQIIAGEQSGFLLQIPQRQE